MLCFVSMALDSAQHIPIYEVANLATGHAENTAEHGLIVFSRNMGDAARRKAVLSQANGWSGSGDPADLWMINFPGKAALTQMRVAIQIFGGLHDRGGDAFALQHHHHLMWRVLRSPFLDPVVELLTILDPRGRLGESMIRQPFPVT